MAKIFCRIIALVTCTLLFFYWAVTVLYCMPNNPIRIAFNNELVVFEKYCHQQWSFFAPPGKFNQRLFYEFSSRSDPQLYLKVEVLEPIFKLKQQKHPFNEQVEVLDYILSGSADQVGSQLRDLQNYKDAIDDIQSRTTSGHDSVEGWNDLADGLGDRENEILTVDTETVGPLQTLVGYSRLVAKNSGLDDEKLQCQITYQFVAIPRFIDRHLSAEKNESLSYRTNLFDVPK
jgi:hypothetical protein